MKLLSVYDHFYGHYGHNQVTLVGQLAAGVRRLVPHLVQYRVDAGPAHLADLRPHPTDTRQTMVAISTGWARMAHMMLKV